MSSIDFVVVGLQPWDIEIGSNCKNIALELSIHHRVLYVNRSLDRITMLRSKKDVKKKRRLESIRGARYDLEQINTNLWVLDPRIIVESVNRLPRALFNIFNKRNNKLIAREITRAIERLGFKKPILFIDNDFFRSLHLPEMLDLSASVYYIRDFLTNQPYFKKYGQDCEIRLMKKCDLVVANSGYLAEYAKKHNPMSFDIGQGCDFSLYDIDKVRTRPEDLPKGKLIVGYVGAIVGYRLDEQLLIECVQRSPHLNWVFVGPEDDQFAGSKLHAFDNVFFCGTKPSDLLPDYISYFDVCINPQKVNELTIGNYPRKVDEYLALGKPVVAVRTEFMRSFESVVRLCTGSEEFITAINESIANNNQQWTATRRELALTHTWENSINRLTQAISDVKTK